MRLQGHLAFTLLCLFLGPSPVAGQEASAVPPEGTTSPESTAPGSELSGAPVDIVIGPSRKELDPLAVPDALCEGPASSCATIIKVLRNDLRISGYFRIIPPATYLANPQTEPIDAPRYADWFNVGAKYMIRARVQGEGGTHRLTFKLYNVVDRQPIATTDASSNGVGTGGLREKAHAFADAVILALTGKPGLFRSRIAFSAKTGAWTRGIYVMDMDGQSLKPVISDEHINALPSFAGDALLYTHQEEGKDPVLMRGGKPLSKSPGKYRKADLGPGGLYAVSVDTGRTSNIWLLDASGTLTRNLTRGLGDNVSPSWSPDGRYITFVSSRSGTPQVHIMNGDGSGQRRLTMAGAYNSTPDFGPDGTIVFAGMDEGHSDLFTVDLAGNMKRLTQGQGSNLDPVWSPDGRWIAFVSTRDGRRIWLMTADGRHQFPLTRSMSCATPAWRR
jgi:TolB protein